MKRDDPDGEAIEHRQAKYLNNRSEADHGPIKKKTAYVQVLRGDADDP